MITETSGELPCILSSSLSGFDERDRFLQDMQEKKSVLGNYRRASPLELFDQVIV